MIKIAPTSALFAITFAFLVVLPLSASADEGAPINPDEEPPTHSFDRLGIEEPEGSARASLATGQGLHGAILGLQTCVLLECSGPRPFYGLPTLGASAGLGLSLLATHERGITPGYAAAINSGTVWGAWIVGAGAYIADVESGRSALGSVMIGQLAGTGAGIALGRSLRVTSGDVLFVNSGALWAIGYYLAIMEGVADRYLSGRQGMVEALAVTTAGGLAGAALASEFPMTRGRLAIINASGMLGALAGGGIPVMIAGEDTNSRVLAASAVGGATIGLGLGTHFTRQWDDDTFESASPSLSIAPTPEVDGFQATISGRW